MAFQTLDREIGYTNKDGEWVGAAVGQQKDTMLERLGAELYDYDGTTGSADPGDPFVLTDSHAEEAIANVREYVGAYVTAYANDKDKIIAIKEVKSTFLTGEFTTLAAAGSIATDDVFKVGDDEYTVDLVTGAVTPEEFVNGEDKTITPAFNTGAEYKIAADVSGKKIKEVYSVSFWDVDDAFLFEDDMLDDESLNSHDFVLDDNDEIDFSSFALLGVDSLEDIDEDNVVYVYNGGNSGKIARIEVGTETGSGEVTKIKGSKYTIGGKVYEFSVATGAIASRPDIGAEIEMVLDYAGDIYDYDVISGESDLYGIVLRTRVAGEDPTNLGSNDAELELFLADGTKKVFTVDYSNFAKKADGTPVASPGIPATVYDQNNTPNASYVSDDQWLIAAGDVIEYALNKDGEIEAIEWIVDADAGLAKRTADTTKVTAAADLTAKGYYQGYKVASDALIMTYGSSFTTDEDDYGVADRAKLIDSTIPANAYFVVEDGQIAFMYISDAATSADSVFGALVDAEKNNSDAGYGVDMLIDGKAVFINSNVDYRSVATYPRDLLYLVEYDVDGDVSSLTPMSLTPGTDYNRSAKTNFDADSACTLNGYVVGISNFGAADTSVFDIDDAVSGPGTVLEITLDADVAVYKWNEDDGEYKVGKLSDIKGKVAVAFFDVVDEDGVYDIVLIMDDATTPAY
jgi:hypothetical protein